MPRDDRHAISLKGLTYQRVHDFCEQQGRSMSGFLEDLIAEKMDAAGVPIPDVVKKRPRKKRGPRSRDEIEAIASKHFTF